MKWRHQEEAKSTTSDKDDVTCTTSAGVNDSVNTGTGSGCRVPAAAAPNSRKPASVMSVADILDLRVAVETPSGDDVTSGGQNGVDPRRL